MYTEQEKNTFQSLHLYLKTQAVYVCLSTLTVCPNSLSCHDAFPLHEQKGKISSLVVNQ